MVEQANWHLFTVVSIMHVMTHEVSLLQANLKFRDLHEVQ